MANEIITDAGIITVGGSTNTVVIGGATYTGDAYSQDQIGRALSDKNVVAAQDVTLGRFELGFNQSFVGDTITMSGNTAQMGGAISVSTGAVTMENSTFSGNTAQMGGAISVSTGAVTMENSTFSGNTATNGGAVILTESSTATVENCTFSCNTATNGGAFCLNRSTATVENCTFSCNTATINGGAIWNEPDSTLTIRDSIFATATDSIHNGGALTLGGTITTAAKISSENAIVVETGTKLVLDLSVYSEANKAAFLSNYDYVFFGQEGNFDIAVKVNAEQTEGDYILASGADSFSKSITLTCGGETSGALAPGNYITFKEHIYSLALSSSYALVLTVSNGIPAGIVTENGDKEKLSIGGNIYAGAAYTPDQISQALSDKNVVAAQDVTLGRFELGSNKSFVGDTITMSGNTASFGGGAIYLVSAD